MDWEPVGLYPYSAAVRRLDESTSIAGGNHEATG